jgi:hypothetical protein
VATPAISIDGVELEKVMRHFYQKGDLGRSGSQAHALSHRLAGDERSMEFETVPVPARDECG